MRKLVFDFSLLEPVPSNVTITTFPSYQIDRLFTKKTHYLDWRRFFWVGIMVKHARLGHLNTAGRYRLEVNHTRNGNYNTVLLKSI